MIELSLGRIDTALALGQSALKLKRAEDPARALVSGALTLKGRFQEAVNVLVYKPSNALDFFSPEELQQVTCDELGKGLVLAMDEEVAGIFRPGRHLGVAQVCLEAGDTENLEQALDRVVPELKSNPVIEHIYCRLRACCCASKADAPGTENNLVRARTLADEVPSRSAKYETHHFAGRAYLLLGRSEAALSELRAAAQLALHSLEKHSTNYWLARGAEAAGHGQEAARIFSLVTADGFNTWMSADARARLNSSRGEDGPSLGRLVIGE
jgi:tetratricopeptide (TPR) repeat protein